MAQSAEGKVAYGVGRDLQARAAANGNTTSLGRLQQVLEGEGVDLADLSQVRVLWHKTEVKEGKEVYAGSSVLLSPSWEEGPKWQPVDRAPLPKVVVPKARDRGTVGRWKTALILPDPQIGYRRTTAGELDPFHDPRVIDISLQVAEAERPDLTIWLGDVLDLPTMSSKFRREPGMALTVQPTIDRATELVAAHRALSKESRFIQGNHDLRLSTYIVDNAEAAYGIKRGGAKGDDWPVLSVPYLLRLDELGVKYVGGYPNGATYINDSLACIHGVKTDLSAVANNERVSVIQGHIHRLAVEARTRNSRDEPHFSVVISPGTMARIDGAVPSTFSSLPDERTGLPVRHWVNWQQGMLVVRYTDDGLFTWEMISVFEGWARHRDQEFVATASIHDR